MPANSQQNEQWNRVSGPIWVAQQAILDRMLAPLIPHLVARSAPGQGRHVLDIGCGAGALTLAMARAVGPVGHSLGVDISAPLVAAARANGADTPNAAFIEGDAQICAFRPQAYDAVVSRFGVMFFDDPVAAFGNIRAALAPGGPLAFVAWRGPVENPFMTTAARAVASLFPPAPAPPPGAPGQFGFADPEHVRAVLTASGWRDIHIEALDQPCVIPAADVMTYVTNLGPVGPAIREADPETRAAAEAMLHTAFEPYVDGAEARFTAACWLVTARA